MFIMMLLTTKKKFQTQSARIFILRGYSWRHILEINKKSNFRVNRPLMAPNFDFFYILVEKIVFGDYDVITVGKYHIFVKNQLCRNLGGFGH